MKLLLYSHFSPRSIGGVETMVLSLARGLPDLCDSSGAPQFEITLVTQTPAGSYDCRALPIRDDPPARPLSALAPDSKI